MMSLKGVEENNAQKNPCSSLRTIIPKSPPSEKGTPPLTRRAESRRVCPPESAANPHVLKTTFVAWTSTSPGAAAFMPASKLAYVPTDAPAWMISTRGSAARAFPPIRDPPSRNAAVTCAFVMDLFLSDSLACVCVVLRLAPRGEFVRNGGTGQNRVKVGADASLLEIARQFHALLRARTVAEPQRRLDGVPRRPCKASRARCRACRAGSSGRTRRSRLRHPSCSPPSPRRSPSTPRRQGGSLPGE